MPTRALSKCCSVDAVAADMQARRSLTAEEARGYGLIDAIAPVLGASSPNPS